MPVTAALADRGVYAAHVPLAVYIGSGGPETQPDTITELYWDLLPVAHQHLQEVAGVAGG
jgi:hypothetical protein